MHNNIAELQNIFQDTTGKWWIESADDLDESDQLTSNEYHGSFDTLSEAERYMNKHFGHPSSYFVDRSKVRHQPFDYSVQRGDPQDRTGSKEVANRYDIVQIMVDAVKVSKVSAETLGPKKYYVQSGGSLYSLNHVEFVLCQDDPGRITGYKVIKHLPTCVTARASGILHSNDPRRPVYYINEGVMQRR